MLPTWTVVGFTGHRSLDDSQRVSAALHRALDELNSKYGPLIGWSSAASGGDTLFLEEVSARNIPFFVVLPLPKDEFKKDFELADWTRAESLLTRAAGVSLVQGAESREEAYLEAGTQTVDKAAVVVAVWDGNRAQGVGGTAQVVEYARRLNRPLMIINPATCEIRSERLERIPKASVVPSFDLSQSEAAVNKELHEYDTPAASNAPRTRLLILYIVLLHLLATMLAILGLVTINPSLGTAFSSLELGALALAAVLGFPRQFRRTKWLKNRGNAEACRSFLAIWHVRRELHTLPKSIRCGDEDVKSGLTILWQLDKSAALSLSAAKKDYLEHRVQDQLKYFKRERDKAVARKRLAVFTATAANAAAVLANLGAFYLHRFGTPTSFYSGIKLLGVVLPLIPPAAYAVLFSLDLSRRCQTFQEMIVLLNRSRDRIEAALTWPSFAAIVAETEQQLTLEVIQWNSMTLLSKDLR